MTALCTCVCNLLSALNLPRKGANENGATAEEIKNAGETLPKAMMTAVVVNGCLGFVMLVTICFTLGDINNILASPTGYPFIQVFFNTTGSYAATNAMTAVLVVTLTASTITEVATASRQLWSFARDNGVPFADFFGYVSKNSTIGSNVEQQNNEMWK